MPPGRVAVSIPLVGQDTASDHSWRLLMTRWKFGSTPDPWERWRWLAAFTFMAATQVHLAKARLQIALGTCQPALPDCEFGDPELGPFYKCDMLQNATFPGFFAIEKTSIFAINHYVYGAYINYTYKHAF